MSSFEIVPAGGVRLCQVDDVTELATFLQTAYADTYSAAGERFDRKLFVGEDFHQRVIDHLDLHLNEPRYNHLFAIRNKHAEIVGTASLDIEPHFHNGTISHFYVAQHAQGQSIGRQLWSTMVGDALGAGLRTIDLRVATASKQAVSMFERRGMQKRQQPEMRPLPAWMGIAVMNTYWRMQGEVTQLKRSDESIGTLGKQIDNLGYHRRLRRA